jgi:hypothetical protein
MPRVKSLIRLKDYRLKQSGQRKARFHAGGAKKRKTKARKEAVQCFAPSVFLCAFA